MMAEPDPKRADGNPKWSLAGAVAAAVGASVCCVGPLLLLALGVGGAWIGNLTAMEKYRPIWTAATLVFLGLAFVRTYRLPKEEDCPSGTACPPNAGRRNKVLLWIVTALVLGLLALPYAIPYAFAGGIDEVPTTREVTLSVQNMMCSACPIIVKKSLTRVEGVRDAKVTLDPPRAVVIYDPAKVGPERLTEATTLAGFPSTVMKEGGTP
jgi:mercuric ion transport protein